MSRSLPTKVIGPPSFRPFQIGRHLGLLLNHVDLLATLTLHRIRVRYKQSVLGFAWALLQPLALMAIYTVIFTVVTKMPSDGAPYSIFVFTALLPWTFFQSSVISSSGSLSAHTNLITKVFFPREILPLTYVLAGLFDFLIASAVLAAMMLYYQIAISLNVLYVIPILLIAITFSLALSLFLAALQVRFRDVGLALPLVIQIWMFATPVVYPLRQVPERLLPWYLLNPMAGVVENFRRVVLLGQGPDATSLESAAIVSGVGLILAYVYFKHQESTMADII